MRKLRHRKLEGTWPKSHMGGGAGFWTRQWSSCYVELRWANTGHLLGWVSDSPQEPTPHSPEVSAEREPWWLLRLLEGKPTVGPKPEGECGNAEILERTGLSCPLLARDCQKIKKIPLCIWLQTDGCKCYWLFFLKYSWFTHYVISTCAAKWFHYIHTYILFFYSFPLSFSTRYWIWFPMLDSKVLVIYFMYSRVHLLIDSPNLPLSRLCWSLFSYVCFLCLSMFLLHRWSLGSSILLQMA